MTRELPKVFRGPDYRRPNAVDVQRVDGQTVCGITAGKARAIKQKFDGNEDSLGVFSLEEPHGTLFLLADSHYGATAGVFAVERFLEFMQPLSEDIEASLFNAHLLLDEALKAHKAKTPHIDPQCATTLLSALLCDNRVHLVSTGDSWLFLLRHHQMLPMNAPHHALFLGDRIHHPNRSAEVLLDRLPDDGIVDPAKMRRLAFHLVRTAARAKQAPHPEAASLDQLNGLCASLEIPLQVTQDDLSQPWSPLNLHVTNDLPEICSFDLKPGDALLLASDGLDRDASGCTFDQIHALLEQSVGDSESAIETVLESVLKHGGRDNCAVIFHRIP